MALLQVDGLGDCTDLVEAVNNAAQKLQPAPTCQHLREKPPEHELVLAHYDSCSTIALFDRDVNHSRWTRRVAWSTDNLYRAIGFDTGRFTTIYVAKVRCSEKIYDLSPCIRYSEVNFMKEIALDFVVQSAHFMKLHIRYDTQKRRYFFVDSDRCGIR